MRSLKSLTYGRFLLSLVLLLGYPRAIKALDLCINENEAYEPSWWDRLRHPLTGCPSDEERRNAVIHIPPSLNRDSRAPLVMNLHALGLNAEIQRWYTGFDETANDNNFIVLYPEGISKFEIDRPFLALPIRLGTFSWNAGGCCSKEPVDDMGYLRKLIAYVVSNYNIDEKRIYVTGMSNGGFMTNRVACEMSDVFAAAAPVAGPLMESYPAGQEHPFGWNPDKFTCDPVKPVPLLHIHSIKDNIVPFEGSANAVKDAATILPPIIDRNELAKLNFFPRTVSKLFVDSIENALLKLVGIDSAGFTSVPNASIPKWREVNNVDGTDTKAVEVVKDSTKCTRYTSSSSNSATVELCEIDSTKGLLGHCWPGDGPFQCENKHVNNQYIWDFFNSHSFDELSPFKAAEDISAADEPSENEVLLSDEL